MCLEPRLVHIPDLGQGAWLQELSPLTKQDLRGQVDLIHFWDFTCINCLRTLPSLRAWHEHYREAGLKIIGVHTPEFDFARNPAFVQAACGRLGIRWPMALDNDQAIWTAFANAAWPTLVLIDPDGYIRYRHVGEGGTAKTEAAIRSLLVESGLDPKDLPPAVEADSSVGGSICLPATPELQVEALGNGTLADGESGEFTIPGRRREGAFYLAGSWTLRDRGLTLTSSIGEIVFPFQANSVHAVLSPFPGPAAPEPPLPDFRRVDVLVDGSAVAPGKYGADLRRQQTTTSLLVDSPRSYDLAADLGPGPHELRLRLTSPGLTLYAFNFGACLAPSIASRSPTC